MNLAMNHAIGFAQSAFETLAPTKHQIEVRYEDDTATVTINKECSHDYPITQEKDDDGSVYGYCSRCGEYQAMIDLADEPLEVNQEDIY